MPRSFDSLIQECATCGSLIDVSGEEPFSLMHCPTCGAAMRVRRHFDHFEIHEKLGSGGMGTVYRALDTNLNREVALKLLQREHSENPEYVAQFQREASITASINHPHVVKVYSTGRDHGLVYIAMELVDKGSLESLMHAHGSVAELQTLTIGIQVAQGLSAALDRGLIHRDIKPGNILFANPATAKIVDFGLAVLAEHASTLAGEVWATPFYVAPEVVEGQPEDFRSDMYSLGATLFHALSGKPPHDVDTNSMSALAAAKKAPVSLQAVMPQVSSATAFALNKVLSHDPTDRQQSYAELIEHLEFARTELASTLHHPEKHHAATGPARPQRSYDWLTALTAAVVVAGGVLTFEQRSLVRRPPPPAAEMEDIPRTEERIAAKYEEARQLLARGNAGRAEAIFAKLDSLAEPPQPQRNWITLHAGLAELFAGRIAEAQAHFATLEKRGLYSTAEDDQVLADFFVQTARRMASAEAITSESASRLDRANHEAIALLLYALKDWSLGAYDEAAQLFRQYSLATPQDRAVWVSDYKPLISPYVVEINLFRTASEGAKNASTLESRQRALQQVRDAQARCKLSRHFPSQLDALAKDLAQKITAEEEETARRLAAIESADAAAISAAQTKVGPLWQQFRPTDAYAVLQAIPVTGEKAKGERAALLKKMQWLVKFKATLINDLKATGYPSPVTKRNGGQIPGPVRHATETQIETTTPFGTLPAPWAELAPESIIAMSKSFLRSDLPAELLADRLWQLGVYHIYVGKVREGQELLVQAGQTKPAYREELALFPGATPTP